jgi:hypothetical protein
VTQHLGQDPTGLSAAFSNVEVNVLSDALVEQVAERRYADPHNIRYDIWLEELRSIAGESHRAFRARRRGAVARDVERNARAGRVLRTGGGDDEKFRHERQYAELMRPL